MTTQMMLDLETQPIAPEATIPPIDALLSELERTVPRGSRIKIVPNRNGQIPDDQYNTWEAIIAGGHSYMVGSGKTREQYLRAHTSRLSEWQRVAYRIAWLYPDQQILIETGVYAPRQYDWVIYRRGEYVDFSLPHQDSGGEKDYVSRDGKTRIQVNED